MRTHLILQTNGGNIFKVTCQDFKFYNPLSRSRNGMEFLLERREDKCTKLRTLVNLTRRTRDLHVQ